MAHVGKLYKLQFRRDLSGEPNNRNGWPEAAIVDIVGVAGPQAAICSGLPYLCLNLLTNSQPPMVWRSDDYVLNGKSVYKLVTVSSPPDSQLRSSVWQIKETATGIILFEVQIAAGDWNGSPSLMTLPVANVTVESPGVHRQFPHVSLEWHAARWAIYNP